MLGMRSNCFIVRFRKWIRLFFYLYFYGRFGICLFIIDLSCFIVNKDLLILKY